MTRLHLDYETKSQMDVSDCGVDLYAKHPSTGVLMCSFKINDETTQQWLPSEGERMPTDLKEGLRDPDVAKWAFNSQFERWITTYVLGIETPIESWRCTMALAYMFSFMGGLDDVAQQMKLRHQKSTRGRQLIKIFCGPNKPSKNQPYVWRDMHSDPVEWEEFKGYNITDTDVEHEMWSKLSVFEIPEWQWDVYHLDQIINDRGLPINRQFVENALEIADRRKSELISEQNLITGLANANSNTQLLPWLNERGYPYHDLKKQNVEKLLASEEEEVENPSVVYNPVTKEFGPAEYDAHLDNVGHVVGDAIITNDCRVVLRKRQGSSKTSTTKYLACITSLGDDDRLRHCFQYAGASRTLRWAGRKIQPQNLPRTPKWLEPEDYINFDRLDYCTDLILTGNYELLGIFAGEQMDAVAGCVRSCIQAPEGKKLVVCDLASIETVTIGWLTRCERLLNVFRDGRDAYKDFAMTLYKVAYQEVTKGQRTIAKPGVLGAGYRLSGGEMRDGEKTGLWAYAEGMGVKMSRDEANRAVQVFRDTYHEIPSAWYSIENAIVKAMQMGGRPVKWGPLIFEVKKPFLRVQLPSGRHMYYYKLQIEKTIAISRAGNEYTKYIISYMGKSQVTNQWTRIESHGGKFIENFVQAIARDILAFGMLAAHRFGFFLVGHVHDELISEEDENSTKFTFEKLRYLMSDYLVKTVDWLKDMPLGAAGYEGRVYKKD